MKWHCAHPRESVAGRIFAQASAAATRLEVAGCEWKNHSTNLEGVRSARFWSASLFMAEMNGSTLTIDRNA